LQHFHLQSKQNQPETKTQSSTHKINKKEIQQFFPSRSRSLANLINSIIYFLCKYTTTA
jgi:hypothetical protein